MTIGQITKKNLVEIKYYFHPQIFECKRMKFAEIPGKLHTLLMPPDPIVINHIITVEGPDARKTACYDIDVEVVSHLFTTDFYIG